MSHIVTANTEYFHIQSGFLFVEDTPSENQLIFRNKLISDATSGGFGENS
jgi:hypothetical protein